MECTDYDRRTEWGEGSQGEGKGAAANVYLHFL